MSKHQNYEILNLLGYGLSKFNKDFVIQMGYSNKSDLYNYLVDLGVAQTTGTVKNRQDLFDNFFDNGRKGWHQKGDAYKHRKLLIDSLFGDLDNKEYSNMIKSRLKRDFNAQLDIKISPLLDSKFKQLQETGREAEEFFKVNYEMISIFSNGKLEDARLYGDGYDFQVTVKDHFYLAEIKGVRQSSGAIRLTEKEFLRAREYNSEYVLTVISNLEDSPKMLHFQDPLKSFNFEKKVYVPQNQITYHSKVISWS